MIVFRWLLESLLELLVISPLYVFFQKKRDPLLPLLGAGFFILNAVLLRLPMYYAQINIAPGGHWNWSGKLYGIIGSVIFYRLFRHRFAKNDFVTFRQQPGSLRPVLLIMGGVIVLVVINQLLSEGMDFNSETLAFQFSMPGFDEELSFRGILMGLLVTALQPQIRLGQFRLGHPGLWITAILFGLIHGFHLSDDWTVKMNWIAFGITGLVGWILGWIALRSRSIVFPTILHNLFNGIGSLIGMIK